MAPQAVYIHIPFCTNKCHYCDFTAYVVKGQPVDDYLSALEREMERTVEQHPPGEIRSVFIGGGTPTVLSPRQMERLCAAIRRYFPRWATDMEFTVEANPGTTEPEKLTAMREGGVNRISFGAQTFRDDLLRRIGRIHTAEDVFRSVEQARHAGFDNLSLDLIFGLPGQTLADMEETLKTAISLRPDHISAYSLKVEEGTLFYTLYQRGEIPLPPEEEEVEMYQLTRRILGEVGLNQYEISNFAHPGKESRHNLTYWRHEEFYGLGAGAHGYVGGVRHANVRGIREYIEKTRRGFPTEEVQHVSRAEAMENFMIFGLRVLSGVEEREFERRFGLPLDRVFGSVLAALQQKGLLAIESGRVRLTEQGLLFGNEVFAAFLGEAENTSID